MLQALADEYCTMSLMTSDLHLHTYLIRNLSTGKTPLHLAAEGGHDTVLQFLMDHPQTPADAIDILDSNNVRLKLMEVAIFCCFKSISAIAYSTLSGLQ